MELEGQDLYDCASFRPLRFCPGQTACLVRTRLGTEECKLLVLSGVGMVLFLFSPEKIGEGGLVGARILYATFLLMVLFGACHLTRKEVWICCLAGILPFALLQQRAVYKASQVFQPYVLQLKQTARHITQCTATLYLPYKTVEPYLDEYAPFIHLDRYLALQTETVLLNNYEVMTNHFPLRLRPAFRSRELEKLRDEFVPAKFSALKSFVVQYPHLVDCVLIWETDHGSVEELEKMRIREFISSTFRFGLREPFTCSVACLRSLKVQWRRDGS